MIGLQDISLEEEAQLYNDMMCQITVNPNTPVIQTAKPKPKIVPGSAKCICYRCGEVGHMSSSCKNDLPDWKELEKIMNDDIDRVCLQCAESGLYTHDEFGLVLKDAVSPVNCEGGWKKYIFCTNCGEVGHTSSSCEHPKFTHIASRLAKGKLPADQARDNFMSIWNS